MKSLASHLLRRALLVVGITTLLPTCSVAQTNPEFPAHPTAAPILRCLPTRATHPVPTAPSSLPPCPVKHHTDTSLSLGVFSQLTIDRTSDLSGLSEQGTAPSTGTLGTFRQTFHSWLGYSVNLGYSRVSQQYRNQLNYGGASNFNINSNFYETSITYIAHTSVNKRLSLFADIGPGLITFLPVPGEPYPPGNPFGSRGLSVQVRPGGVFGSGVDVRLTHRLDLRAEYRGLSYNNPDFRTGDALSKQITVTSEPTLSLVYHLRTTNP